MYITLERNTIRQEDLPTEFKHALKGMNRDEVVVLDSEDESFTAVVFRAEDHYIYYDNADGAFQSIEVDDRDYALLDFIEDYSFPDKCVISVVPTRKLELVIGT